MLLFLLACSPGLSLRIDGMPVREGDIWVRGRVYEQSGTMDLDVTVEHNPSRKWHDEERRYTVSYDNLVDDQALTETHWEYGQNVDVTCSGASFGSVWSLEPTEASLDLDVVDGWLGGRVDVRCEDVALDETVHIQGRFRTGPDEDDPYLVRVP